jgi:N-acetylmuramoyl-L-alanine amidase
MLASSRKPEGRGMTTDIKQFQIANGLVADGVPGPQTRLVMREVKRPASKRARKEPNKAAMEMPVPQSAPLAKLKSDAEIVAACKAWVASLPSTSRLITEIIWHCTATPDGRWFDRNDINAWHKARGFTLIGYHGVVYLDGTPIVGRPIGQVGAHCADHGKNTGTIGLSYVGGVSADGKMPKDTRTQQQRIAMLTITRELKKKFPSIKKVTGHNAHAAKACPSFFVANDELGKV